jgi:thiamine pyrophosphate-dependent acetolactate synthase large subunit-like protein
MDESKQKFATDLIVDLFRKYGIEYVIANIGSTFRTLWESLVNYGNGKPQVISALHEEIAVGVAHGYAKVKNKPMVVLLHDTVGLLHATMAIYNAWCDRVPMILIGANGPLDVKNRRPWIDWVHTTILPNNMIRDYVKWDDYATSMESFLQSFTRAYNITNESQTAPVFIGVDVNVLEQEPMKLPDIPEVSYTSTKVYPDLQEIKNLINLINNAEYPLIIAGRIGLIHENIKKLISFAEFTGSRVIDTLEYFNFPNTHALDATFTNAIENADIIIAIDTLVLDYYLYKTDKLTREHKPLFKSDAKVFVLGNPLFKSWTADYEDLIPAKLIRSDTEPALDALINMVKTLPHSNKERINDRIEKAKEEHERLRKLWFEEAKTHNERPLHLARFNLELWNIITENNIEWILTSSSHGSAITWSRKIWEWTKPGCYIGWSRGAGLGYGLPVAVGASLAIKDSGKIVIDLQADGDLLYTPSALWIAAHHKLPLIIVMYNNRAYYNDADHNALIAKMRNRNVEKAFKIGGEIKNPEINFATLAKSFGLIGIGPVDNANDLSNAFRDAVYLAKGNKVPILIDAIVS